MIASDVKRTIANRPPTEPAWGRGYHDGLLGRHEHKNEQQFAYSEGFQAGRRRRAEQIANVS